LALESGAVVGVGVTGTNGKRHEERKGSWRKSHKRNDI
jgi:hypothetical protein